MSTRKQRAASRANAQKSTGPRTPEGKAASRFNALKHGIDAKTQIMFTETAEDLVELTAELHDRYRPADPTERFLVDTLVNNEWRLRRLRSIETDLWIHATDTFIEKHKELDTASPGDAFAIAGSAFERLQRIVNSCERNYHRALKELQAVQDAARAHNLSTTQPEESKTTSESPASIRTTPQNPATAAPKAPPQPLPNPALPAQPSVDGLVPQQTEEIAVVEASFQAAFRQS